jgi:hypothetical protein
MGEPEKLIPKPGLRGRGRLHRAPLPSPQPKAKTGLKNRGDFSGICPKGLPVWSFWGFALDSS